MNPLQHPIYGLALLLTIVSSSCAAPADAEPTTTPEPTGTAPASVSATPTPPLNPSPSIPGTVTIWVDWGPEKLVALERILDSYLTAHPGAQFRVVFIPTTELVDRFTSITDEEEPAPSLIVASSRLGPGWYESGLLRAVTEVLPPEQAAEIYPVAWSQVQHDGQVIGLPFELKGTLLFRNAELAPAAASTVADLVERAEELKASTGRGADFDLGFERAAPLLQTCKGELVLDETVDPVLRPAGLCWLRLLDRLASAGAVTFNSEEDEERFAAGDSAWLLAESSEMQGLRQALGEDVLAVDDWPLYRPTGESLTGYVWTDNLYFPQAAAEQDFEAAWSFAIYLLAPENQDLLSEARDVDHIPVVRSVELEDPLMRIARRSLQSGIALPDLRPLEDIARELGTAVRLVASQGGEPELALELALDEIRRARIPTATPTRTAIPSATPTATSTPLPSPPPG